MAAESAAGQESASTSGGEPPSGSAGGPEDGGEIEELVELQVQEEARLEKLFAESREKRGLDDEETLRVFFKLFDMWIQLYRLNKCAEVLVEIVPICRRRGDNFHIQGVQALAFTRWKQGAFREAAQHFHEIEDLLGSSAALCENMGHTYSSLGDFKEASKYFKRSLMCMDHEQALGKKAGDRAGVLLGLGLIEDRQGNIEAALTSVREAQRLFRLRAGEKPSSLVAKAGMSIARILLKLAKVEPDVAKRRAMEEEAVEREFENVALFEVTCGDDSPLTATALRGLGEALMRCKRIQEAKANFARSYALEASKDAFDLLAIMEIHNFLVNAHMVGAQNGGDLDRAAFVSYLPTVELTLQRVRAMPQDANTGAYYKVAGELRAFAEDYAGAVPLLKEAIELFEQEKKEPVTGLIENCEALKDFCEARVSSVAPRCRPAEYASEAA